MILSIDSIIIGTFRAISPCQMVFDGGLKPPVDSALYANCLVVGCIFECIVCITIAMNFFGFFEELLSCFPVALSNHNRATSPTTPTFEVRSRLLFDDAMHVTYDQNRRAAALVIG